MVEISIVMPVYNCEDFLEESIRSILDQSFTDIELICVDDGSTDASLSILQDYARKDERMKVFHQENKGGGDARNFALTMIEGKYLIFVDSDDILCPDALRKNYELINERNVDFIFFKSMNYDDDTQEYIDGAYYNLSYLHEIVGEEIFSYEDIPDDMILRLSATPWGKFYNAEFVLKSGAQFAEGIIFHDNKFFWEMLFNSKRICFNNELFYLRRIHSSSIQESKDERYINIFTALNGVLNIFRKYGKLERYKIHLYNWKIRNQHMRYTQIQEQYKQAFLDEFKRDLSALADEEGCDSLMEMLNPENAAIYENVFKSQTYREYDLLDEIINLNREIDKLKSKKSKLDGRISKLKDENSKLKKENARLKKNINKLENKNEKLNKRISEFKSRKAVRLADKLRF